MFSAELHPLWHRLAWSSFISFGVLYLVIGALVLTVSIRHHTNDYHDALSRLTRDLTAEYAASSGDLDEMRRQFATDIEEHGRENVFLLLSSPRGEALVAESCSAHVLDEMARRSLTPRQSTYRIAPGKDTPAIRVRKSTLDDGNILSVGWNVAIDERHLVRVGTMLALSLLFSLAIGAVLGAILARRITSPLQRIAGAAKIIANGDWTARVAQSHESREISALERAFNMMAAKNEKTLADLKALADDIAHDLRTPLTRMRGAAEITATRESCSPDALQLAVTVSEESSAMLDMINTMLDISQTNSLRDRSPRESIEMVSFLRDILDLYSASADEAGISLRAELPACPVEISAHRGKMQRMIGNILDNALKFTPRHGVVTVRLASAPFSLSIANTGSEITPEDIPFVFKRFWRAEKSRSLPGNGLGLALAKAIAVSYGWRISCRSTPGAETVFEIAARQQPA